MESFLLFSTSNSIELAEEVASKLNSLGVISQLSHIKLTRFQDGEFKVKVEASVRRKEVFVIASTNPPAENLLELFMIIDALRRASAESISVVIPYYGFARQDRKAGGRESITAKMIARLLETLGVNRVICMDLHADQIQGFFDIPADNLHGHLLIADALKLDFPNGFNELVVVSPDTGGLTRVKILSKILPGSSFTYCSKERNQNVPDTVDNFHLDGNVNGKAVLIYDDVASTLKSTKEAIKEAVKAGAKSVSVAVIHYACTEEITDSVIAEKLPINKIYTTNTNPRAHYAHLKGLVKIVSVANLLAETIKRVINGDSVSKLFERE